MGLNLLWATDGSEESEQVLPILNHLLLPAADRLTIMVVAPRPLTAGTRLDPTMLLWDLVPGYQDKVTAEVVRIAEHAAAMVPRGVAQVETAVRLGRPLDEIDLFGREIGADIVLVGARGHSGLATLLRGSLSQSLLHRVPSSVLVGRPGGEPRSILLATDGTPPALVAEELLLGLKPPAEVRLTTLCVAPGFHLLAGTPPPYLKEAERTAEEIQRQREKGAESAADHAAGRLRAAGWDAASLERDGDPAEQILAVAEEADADLIVMGSLSHRPPGRFLLGGTASNVSRHASCSVLVARRPQ